jgi:hypothetical protein
MQIRISRPMVFEKAFVSIKGYTLKEILKRVQDDGFFRLWTNDDDLVGALGDGNVDLYIHFSLTHVILSIRTIVKLLDTNQHL